MNDSDSQSAVPGVSDWVQYLCSVPDKQFLTELQELNEWPFQNLDDLSAIIKVLDRIEKFLQVSVTNKDYPLLETLLSKTLILLSSSSSKSLYNSVPELVKILDFSSWTLIYQVLQVIHLLVNRVNPIIKETKAHTNPELVHKLYVIGLGSNLNCSTQVSLQSLIIPSSTILDFQYISNEELITSRKNIPSDLKYVLKNRKRTNEALKSQSPSTLQFLISSQLLSLSCLMQIPPETQILQDFCRSLPELWLLPAVAELIKMRVSVEVHIQCINILAAILVMMEGQTTRHELSQNHLINSTQNMLAAWQQHGLMQTLLRDLTSSTGIVPVSTGRDNRFIQALLHLASIIADYKYRVDSSHVPGMTCSLLMLIQNPQNVTLTNLSKAVRILSVIVSHSIDMFKVIGGLETVVKLLMREIGEYNEKENKIQAYLIRALLRLIKIVATKWDPSHILSHNEVSFILFDSGLLPALKRTFYLCKYEIFEPSLQLLCLFVGFYKHIIQDLNDSGAISALLCSLDNKLPNNAKLVGVIAKFLGTVTVNEELCRVLKVYSTIERLLEALGSGNSIGLTSELAESIGENLQTLMTNVPDLIEKAANGCVALVKSLNTITPSKILSREAFFPQLANIAKIFSILLSFSPTLIQIFIDKKGLEGYLQVFRLRILPLTYNNEFHSFASCMKSIPLPSSTFILEEVIKEVNTQLNLLEQIVGPLNKIFDLSHISNPEEIVFNLTACDSYIEITRFLLQNGAVNQEGIESLCEILERLAIYMRILIAEQARLSPFSKRTENKTTVFNQPINIHDIENVAMKSFEENFYFTCQLTVRKLYRFTTTRMTSSRGRHPFLDKGGVKMSNTMGGILASLIKLINLDSQDQGKAYYFCLQLSDILKILLQDQHPNPTTIITFHHAGGSEHVYKFLLQLREVSSVLNDDKEKSYDLVNSLQILWNLCGKFLEVLAMGKYSMNSFVNGILKALGYESPKHVNKVMQDVAHEYLKGLNYLECGIYSTAFAKSTLDILKVFSNLDKVEPDSDVIQSIVEMGFSESSVINASKTLNTLDIGKILEYLTTGKELKDLPEDHAKIDNLHYILINSLPAIPILKNNVAELLLKICSKNTSKVKEIVLMLMLELGTMSFKLLNEQTLYEDMKDKATLSLLDVKATFDQLGACISVLSVLVHKSNEVLEFVSSLSLVEYTIRIMEKFTPDIDPAGLRCLSPLFSLIEGLVKIGKQVDTRLTIEICSLIKTHKNTPAVEHGDLISLLHLLTTLTQNTDHGKILLESKAISVLLTLKSSNPEEKSVKSTISHFTNLLKQLVEDPYILQGNFEVTLLQNFKPGLELKDYLKQFSGQIVKNKKIFQLAFENVCKVLKEGHKFVVSLKKNERKELGNEKWKTFAVICQGLCEVFEGEQKGFEYIMPSQALVSVMADLLQLYPVLIKDVISLSVKKGRGFLSYLFRKIVPFRYTLHLDDGKVVFYHPETKNTVPPEVYQYWLKSTSRLVRALTFKQQIKNYSAEATEVYNSIILDNNLPVLKARKKIFSELKEMLLEQGKKQWFGNEKSMAVVRSVVMTIMQLLRDVAKAPFTSNNPTEIAKNLISEQINMVKLLSDIAKGVKINFKKAGAMLNLILSPLDLLTKYNISFTVHSNKPDVEMEQDENDEDLNKFEIYEAEARYGDEQVMSSSSDMSMEADNDLDDSESEVEENIEQEIIEEEDDEDLLEESDQAEENLENIQVQDRNTETFWADNAEEELDPAISIWNPRQAEEFNLEQDALERELQIEGEPGEIWSSMRGEPIRWDRSEVDPQMMNFFTEFDESDQELMQFVMQRNRFHLDITDRNSKPKIEDDTQIEEMVNILSKTCEIQETKLDPLFLQALSEESKNDIFNNVDEEFLQAIPEDIREELLSLNNPRDEIDNMTFIASLTPELRREVLMTASEELLGSLAPDIVAEARVLQERVAGRRQANGERVAKPVEEGGKVINDLVADEKLANTLASVEDGFLEVLIRSVYLLNPINRDIFASLLLNLSVQSGVRAKVVDAFLCLLMQVTPVKDFPPQKLYGSETYLENYSQVYAIVTGRILDLLLHLAQNNPKVTSELLVPSKQRLTLIKALKSPEDSRGISILLTLTKHKLFESSSSHLNPLINLLSCIFEKQQNDFPSLDPPEIQQICELFKYESLSEPSVKMIVDLVTSLIKNPINKSQIEKILHKAFSILGQEISENLKIQQTSKDGQKELQLLRIYKVFKIIAQDHSGLDYIWGPLTEVLNTITQRDSDFASTANPTLSKLLPLIETFFLSHIGQSNSESFQKFCDKHRKVLNILVKQNPSLLQDTFKTLVTEFPALLDFENKRTYFRSEIRKMKPERNMESIRLQVRRAEVFEDSFHQLKVRTPGEMHGKLRVSFIDEDGVDAGGLTREWYGLLAREMFNPNYALFIPSANGVSFQPNCMSSINAEHLEYFKFIGRIIGKALCDGFALDVYFTRSFYKHILGQEVDYHDMEDLDPDFFKNLKMLMDINLNESELHEYYFAYEEEEFGIKQLKELEPGGMQKRVTEENKMEYIKLLCHMKMTQNISLQISSFLEGFHELLPKSMICIFDSKELELLISGLPEIDIDDLKANTEYHNFTKDSPTILWLWEVLFEFSHEERAEFLQFVTGSSKVPLEGFKALPGMSGVQKFQIHKSFTSSDRLPTAHTCMNQIDLPEYPSKEVLRNRIQLAITEGKEGFGFM